MNREDLSIIPDEFSGTTFNEGRIVVLGWCGRYSNGAKIYAIQCNDCAIDAELFGDGIFKTVKRSLQIGILPCACGKKYIHSEQERRVQMSRLASSRNVTFIDFSEHYKGVLTKLILSCPSHGVWSTTSILNFQSGNGCPDCRKILIGDSNRKEDCVMIESFMASGTYDENTKFWRSDRRDNSTGGRVYWNVHCPICDQINTSHCGDLQKGKLPCACTRQSPSIYSYVMKIMDGDLLLYLKFGVSSDPKRREKVVDSKSKFKVELLFIWEFENQRKCKAAEKECKEKLLCGVVKREFMLDGWSETTYTQSLDMIRAIFSTNGGSEIENY